MGVQELADLTDQDHTTNNKCSVLSTVASVLKSFPAAVKKVASSVAMGASLGTDAARQVITGAPEVRSMSMSAVHELHPVNNYGGCGQY